MKVASSLRMTAHFLSTISSQSLACRWVDVKVSMQARVVEGGGRRSVDGDAQECEFGVFVCMQPSCCIATLFGGGAEKKNTYVPGFSPAPAPTFPLARVRVGNPQGSYPTGMVLVAVCVPPHPPPVGVGVGSPPPPVGVGVGSPISHVGVGVGVGSPHMD